MEYICKKIIFNIIKNDKFKDKTLEKITFIETFIIIHYHR
jgi:hypothetical protein